VSDSRLLLEAHGIGRRGGSGGAWLLRDISLSLHTGERLALHGPSGAGKSLLLRALALLDPLEEGDVLWRGQPVVDALVPEFRRQVMYLPQRPALFEGNVAANLQLPFTLKAYRGRSFDQNQLLALLAQLGRDASFLARSQSDLSGGEAQLVAILRALQLAPTVLLLDEPTAALDAAAVHTIENLVASWLGEHAQERAVVWVSHDASQAKRVATRTLGLQNGRLQADG
jgi:putative ABC transport system ATP-binding protein